MTVRVLVGDCREQLRALPDESVHCVVTSPPYFGLRDYGVAGQIGLEPTPADFVAAMVEVFREVRRVLRNDGTLWLNLGDSYAGNGGQSPQSGRLFKGRARQRDNVCLSLRASGDGLKPKDLIGIPWMVAFALRADGWFLRQDIVWSKPNPMPESVTDRCTKSHEYVFLFSKSGRYYFDQEAILEPVSPNSHPRLAQDVEAQIGSARANGGAKTNGNMKAVARGKSKAGGFGIKNNSSSFAESVCLQVVERNKRSVWAIATQPFRGAHFATYPPALVEPCILAGCPRGGVTLDPFGGAGTTGLVAERHGRNSILIELNPEFARMARDRIRGEAPLLAEVS